MSVGQQSHPLDADAKPTSAIGNRVGSCALDLEGLVTWISEGDHPLFSGESDPIGTPFASHWLGADRLRISRALTLAFQQGRSRMLPQENAERRLHVSFELRRDTDRRPMELLVSVNEAPPLGPHFDALDRSLFDAVPVAMLFACDPECNEIRGNPEASRRYGTSPDANHSFSNPDSAVFHLYRIMQYGVQVEAAQLPLQRAGRGQQVLDAEFELRFHDGHSEYRILNAAPLRNKQGTIVGSVCVDTDITQIKKIEAAQASLLECSRATGHDFFEGLVRAISETLGARQVYVAEVCEDDEHVLRTIAAHIDGVPGTYGEFTPHDTPCAEVVKGTMKFIPTGVLEAYPNAPVLQKNCVDSYIGTPLRDAKGKVIGIIGVLHNRPMDESLRPVEIVEIFAGRAAAEIQRIRSDKTLRQSEQKYRIITDVIPSLIAFIDTEERYQFANAAYHRWFGLNPADLRGQTLLSVLGEANYVKLKPYMRRALSGERVSFENRVTDMPGPERHLQIEYVPQIVDSQVRGFFAFISDITANKAAAEALAQSEQQFRTLFEHLPLGVALVDCNGTPLLENDLFSKLLPAANADVRRNSRSFERACSFHDSDGMEVRGAANPVNQALYGLALRDVELLCRRPEGRQSWVRMTAIPIRGGDGAITGALVVVADIHGEKRDEARRTLLINELNHRVKNTLASVQSIASQTFRNSPLTSDGLHAFEERLLALSNAHNLLTQEHWEGADMTNLVALVLEPLDPGGNRLRANGPSIRLKPPAALAFAMALHELATNAVKYGALSAPAGKVDLQWNVAERVDGRRLRVTWVEQGGPPVKVPTRRGFGTRLIERALAFELASETAIRYEPAGVVCEIDADLSEIGS